MDTAKRLGDISYWTIEVLLYLGAAWISYRIHPHFWGMGVAVIWGCFMKLCLIRMMRARLDHLNRKTEEEFKERFGEWKMKHHGTVAVTPREGESIDDAIERVARKIREALKDEETAVTEEERK